MFFWDVLWQIMGVLGTHPPYTSEPWSSKVVRPVVDFAATYVFGIRVPGIQADDSTFEWVLLFCWVVFAIVVTVIWSVLDRNRTEYVWLFKWFRVVVRFLLATEMFGYGFSKVFDVQMPFQLNRLVEPFGNFSPEGLLWAQVASSHPYEVLLGCAEVTAGVLIVVPRTVTLGALLALVDMSQVFVLNMTFDIRLKMMSLSFIALGLFLLAPELRRLATFFLSDHAVPRTDRSQLFRDRRTNRWAAVAQVAVGLLIALVTAAGFFGQALVPKPPLYGLWNVTAFAVDGRQRAPLLTDDLRWRNLVFDAPFHVSEPVVVTVQHMDGSFEEFGATVDRDRHVIEVRSRIELGTFRELAYDTRLSYSQPDPHTLLVTGRLDGHQVDVRLTLTDLDQFTMLNSPFRWAQEYPNNR